MSDFQNPFILGLAEAKQRELRQMIDKGQHAYTEHNAPKRKDYIHRRVLAWLGNQMVLLGNKLQERYSPSFCPADLCTTQEYR